MVSSIHQAGRIGVIPPPGQLRKVGHRNQPRKDPREEGDKKSQTAEEEVAIDDSSSDQGSGETSGQIAASAGNTNPKQTGRRIDVKI